jgi:hypothetical protein
MHKETDELKEALKRQASSHACSPIDGAMPQWPAKAKHKAQWLGLHLKGFVFAHHSNFSRKTPPDVSGGRFFEAEVAGHGDAATTDPSEAEADFSFRSESLFCVPMDQSLRLQTILTKSVSVQPSPRV